MSKLTRSDLDRILVLMWDAYLVVDAGGNCRPQLDALQRFVRRIPVDEVAPIQQVMLDAWREDEIRRPMTMYPNTLYCMPITGHGLTRASIGMHGGAGSVGGNLSESPFDLDWDGTGGAAGGVTYSEARIAGQLYYTFRLGADEQEHGANIDVSYLP